MLTTVARLVVSLFVGAVWALCVLGGPAEAACVWFGPGSGPMPPCYHPTPSNPAITTNFCKQTAGQPSHCLNNPTAVNNPTATNLRPTGCRWYVSGTRRVFLCSDARLKREIVQIGSLSNGIAVYRFKYLWSDRLYVGVLAQEVRRVMPDAVVAGPDGFLRVDYSKVGMSFMTWRQWTHPRSAQPTAPSA